MPSFPRPSFPFTVNLQAELDALRNYRDTKEELQIPAPTNDNLRIATWNIANLGAQDRTEKHVKLIAEIISWFDVIAIQETKDNFADLYAIKNILAHPYKCIFSDAGGNDERMAFIYNSCKMAIMEEIAELSIPPSDFRFITLPGVDAAFNGFDRNPYMVSFKAKNFLFILMNVHLYYGDDTAKASINRRRLEAYAVGRSADLRGASKFAYTTNILALGDFNLPKVDETDPVYKALLSRGLQLPEHTSKVYSNISDDAAYDQVAFLPGMKSRIISHGIFPFDNIIFADLYKKKTAAEFKSYIKYYISDHRPLWINLSII
ncbi:MAG: endonuclease/exonuclease/phosphatase family protein [Parafilimonas sp.]